MVMKIEKQLTLEVLKDVYLFVSQLKAINSAFLYYWKKVFDREDLSIGNFGKYFALLFLCCAVSCNI